MTGIRFQRVLNFDDVLVDGSLVGTVYAVPGGWAFYAAGASPQLGRVPTAVGHTRYDTVVVGLRATAGGPSAES